MKKIKECKKKLECFFLKIPESKWYIMAVLAILITPILIAMLIYCYNPFTWVPGSNETWLGFWASYIGAIVTLFVAHYTKKNSKSIEDLQTKYYKLDTSANLRLLKASIIPRTVQAGVLDQYWIILMFENKAKCFIHEITIPDFKITITFPTNSNAQNPESIEETIEIPEKKEKQDFLFQENNPILQFPLKLSKPSMKKAFAQFCYYYSQFSPDISSMQIKMTLKIEYGPNKDIPDSMNGLFETTLLPSPVIEKRHMGFDISEERYFAYAYETYIKSYSLYTSTTN